MLECHRGKGSQASGRLFNVSSLGAVEIKLKTGKTYRIGTDEPQALERAIRQAMG